MVSEYSNQVNIMKNKQHLKSFEGDLFFIDIIWTSGDKPATFEVRATNADTDATNTITNHSAILGMLTGGKKTSAYMKEEVWNCSSTDAEMHAQALVKLLSQEAMLQQLEEFLESDLATGGWDDDDSFDSELAFDEDDLDDDHLFDDDDQQEESF
jgi:hypothetical protein